MSAKKLEKLMASLEKIADRPTPETKVFDCYGIGGLVSCKAPVSCNEECYRYNAVMLKPTEHWGRQFFKTQNMARYNDRITLLKFAGVVTS